MEFCIVNADGIIENIIVADEAFAFESGAVPSYDGAAIGEEYAPPQLEPDLELMRENSYNTEKIIEWSGDLITVTEAAALWQYYAAEGSSKADEIQTLIAAAKQEIRETYPA